ncbi:MBL fold metallo-hydrolase [Nocardiopsis coralliicola]
MLIAAFPAGPLAANCYVAAAEAGGPCVVVDPGMDARGGLAELLAEHRLTPAAVLLTHGHFDHVWSAADVAAEHGVPVCVHPADRHLLTDPAAGLDAAFTEQLRGVLGGFGPLAEPPTVHEVRGAQDGPLPYAGLGITAEHTPGHTPGSVVYRLPGGAGPDSGADALFTGDLLFAGSIGRTDLPGGDHAQILESLRATAGPDAADASVLPGHGPATSIARERSGNPFLAGFDVR